MEKCNILCLGIFDIRGDQGCLKKEAHNDAHICRDEEGQLWEWEDDYSCACGCWDDYEGDEVCRVYNKITEQEFLEKTK